MLHQEVGGVATFAATKAFVDVAGRRNIERWGLFRMEWTKADEVDPPALEGDKILHNLFDPGGFQDLLHTFFRNQER